MRSRLLAVLLLVLSLSLSSVHAATFDWVLQTDRADWPGRASGGVECWPLRLSYLDRGGAQRVIPAGGVANTGCPLILWGGADRRSGATFTDVWISTDAGKTWAEQGSNMYAGSDNAGYTISSRGVMAKVQGSYTTAVVTTRDAASFDTSYTYVPGPAGRSFVQVQFNERGDLYLVGSDAPIRSDVWRSQRDDCCVYWELQGYLPAPRGSGALLYMGGAANVNNNQADQLLYMGGISEGVGASNEVYITVDSGVTWATMLQAPWSPRWNHNAELTRDKLIVLAGGIFNQRSGGLKDLNDVWLSPDGGWTWTACQTNPRAQWSDREWLMTVIDQSGYVYVMGGSDYDGQETLSDVWRSATSLHDLTALRDQCSLPTLRSGCPSYGLLCIPPSLPGGASTVTTWANSSYTVSCDACPLPGAGATTAYIAAVVAAVLFSLAFAAAAGYVYLLYTRAQASGQTALFGMVAPVASSDSTDTAKVQSTDSADRATNGTAEESKEAYHKL